MRTIILSIGIAIILIGITIFLTNKKVDPENLLAVMNNVRVVDGTQIIEISAKGGYAPHVTEAKAGIPTILRVSTNGTFDCSSSLVIPAIDYRSNLPISGTTDIPVPPQAVGAELNGTCGMGMYNFSIRFN